MDYEEILEMQQNDPKQYQEFLDKGYLFTPEQQRTHAAFDTEQLFDYLLNTKLTWYLHTYPQYASPAMRELEKAIVDQFNNTLFVAKEDLPIIRHTLGSRAVPHELVHLHKYTFTVEPPAVGEFKSSSAIEYFVSPLTRVSGSRFLVTPLKDAPFVIAFYPEEIGQILPEKANAYSVGADWCWNMRVHNNQAESPLVTNTRLSPLDVPDGDYQVIPLCFYDAVIDTSTRYTIKEERDDQGNRILNIVPREEKDNT